MTTNATIARTPINCASKNGPSTTMLAQKDEKTKSHLIYGSGSFLSISIHKYPRPMRWSVCQLLLFAGISNCLHSFRTLFIYYYCNRTHLMISANTICRTRHNIIARGTFLRHKHTRTRFSHLRVCFASQGEATRRYFELIQTVNVRIFGSHAIMFARTVLFD